MTDALQILSERLKGELYTDELHQSLYATDASVYRMLPLAVAFPRSKQDIKELIAFANANNTSLIPRAAGTSLAGQCVGEGIVVDVSKYFTKIISLNEATRTVTLQPGVVRDELNMFLKPHGLFFGPNTSTSNRCMIGGMVGNNSSGTTSIKYGVTRDKIISVKALLSNGEEVEFKDLNKEDIDVKREEDSLEGNIYQAIFDSLSSEKTRKQIYDEFPKPEIHRRNTGYALDVIANTSVFENTTNKFNLSKLICGSEGTLAFITEITLQLDEIPPRETAMLVAHYRTLTDCLNDVNSVMERPLYTCEMIDDVILNCTKQNKKYDSYRFFVKDDPKVLLLLELKETTRQKLLSEIEELTKGLNSSGLSYHHPVLQGEEITMAMELRKAGLGLLGNMIGNRKAVACIEDTAVALEDLPAFIGEFTGLMDTFKQKAVYYAHAGAGELHLRPILNLKQKEDVVLFRAITTAVAQLTKKYKGSFSGEHGDGIVRSEFIPTIIGESNYELVRQIKEIFDPNAIFNPGKIVDPKPMDKALRYVPDRQEPSIETVMNFDDSEGILRLAEKCNGSGDCRKSTAIGGTMCPSYQATKNEKDSTRGRANVLREVLTATNNGNSFNSPQLQEAFALCISCKACSSECPSNVDMSTAKAEFQYQYAKTNGRKRSEYLFGKSSKYNRIAAKFPRISNALFTNKTTGKIFKNWSGIASEREIPLISTKSFSKVFQNTSNQYVKKLKEVVLFIDEFSNYLDASIAKDAYELLLKLGYNVTVVDHLDSARALLSKGFLEEAKQHCDTNIKYLSLNVSNTIPLIGIEPSAILGFRDEYLRLASDINAAKQIANRTFLIEEFLVSEMKSGAINSSLFTEEEKQIKIHVHCHQKALSNQKVTFDLLNFPKNYQPTIIPSGCCGMAGSFGYEKQNYEVSMQIGELKLFPAIRKTSEHILIAANGTSCRHQIKDGTQREALHPITILRRALV